MDKMYIKNMIKKIIVAFLLVVLCTASLSDVVLGAPIPYKNVRYYFRNITTDEEKEIIKEHFYFYNVTTDEYTYPSDDNLLVNETGQYAGCYYIAFEKIGLSDEIRMINSDGMIISRVQSEDGCYIYYSVHTLNLNVEGTIIDTIYTYGVGVTLPYDGTEEIFKKEDQFFDGWYNAKGVKVAEAKNGHVSISNFMTDELTLYARWSTHTHDWSDEWISDEYSHWHECEGAGECDITENSKKDGYGTHDFSGEGVVITEATCEEQGIIRTYCLQEGCKAYRDESYSRTHKMGEWVTVKEPTADEKGIKERKCEYCDYKETEDIQALGQSHKHDFSGEEKVINEATCTKTGLKRIYCTDKDCTEYIEEVLPSLRHLYKDEWVYDDESHYKVCQRCGNHKTEEAHTFAQWEREREATAEEDGLEVCACEICGYKKSRSIKYIEEETTTKHTEETTTKHTEETTTKNTEDEIISEKEDLPVKTSDNTAVKIYATMAMIAGFAYVLAMFGEKVFGMSEKQKDDIVARLIKWGKNKNRIVKGIAVILIFIVLLYYHAIGKNIEANVRSEVLNGTVGK